MPLSRVAAGRDKDGKEVSLEPLAIELATRDTLKGGAGVVYSRHQLRAAKQDILWQLAKAVFRSLENTSLQLHNHWLRSHATQEPYIIALRRNLSVMHPGTPTGSHAPLHVHPLVRMHHYMYARWFTCTTTCVTLCVHGAHMPQMCGHASPRATLLPCGLRPWHACIH